MRAIGLRTFFALVSAACALFFFGALPAFAATDCSSLPGTRPATADDAVVKNGTLKVGDCYNPNDTTIGKTDEEAKQYLRSILCPPDADNYGGLGPEKTISGLDAKFAVCAAKFLKAERSNGVNVCVREGARSVEKQQEYVKRGVLACNKGAACEHPRGIAIDVNVKPSTNVCSSYLPLHQLAGQFGLKFYLGCRDAYHMVPAIAACTAGGNVPAQSSLPASYYDFPAYYQQSPFQTMPYSAPSTLPPLTTTPTQTVPIQSTPTANTGTTQSQPQVCNPTYSCSGGTMYYQTTSCTTQVYQLCVYGCDGNACRTASTTSSTIGSGVSGAFSSTSSSTSDDTSGNDNTNTNTNTNISDILNALSIGDMFSSAEVGTSAPLSLNPSIFQGSSLQASGTQYPAGTLVASGTIQSMQPVGSQSTFTTQDLANNPGAASIQSSSAVFSILEGMKNALLGALNFLLSLGR